MTSHYKVALTIAGSDPSGGAGLQADLKTFAALKIHGFSAVTAIIAQNSARVARVLPVDADLLAAQIETLVEEYRPGALKIGALATAANVAVVARVITALRLPAPVLDPVLISSSGARLLDSNAEKTLLTDLLPLTRVVTPNLPEAETLSGIKIDSPAALHEAARALLKHGAQAVIIKGGHQFGHETEPHRSTDLFFDGENFLELSADRLPGDGAHGTGCAFSAAIAAELAHGAALNTAVRRAKDFVVRALSNRYRLGSGRYLLDHLGGASQKG